MSERQHSGFFGPIKNAWEKFMSNVERADAEMQLDAIQQFLEAVALADTLDDQSRRNYLAMMAQEYLVGLPGIDGLDFGEVDVVFKGHEHKGELHLGTWDWLEGHTSHLLELTGRDPQDFFPATNA